MRGWFDGLIKFMTTYSQNNNPNKNDRKDPKLLLLQSTKSSFPIPIYQDQEYVKSTVSDAERSIRSKKLPETAKMEVSASKDGVV